MRAWLLVYGDLGMGGIETLIVRFANYLSSTGNEVGVLVSGGRNIALLNPRIRVLRYSDSVQSAKLGSEFLEGQNDDPGPVMLSFDPISAALGLSIEAALSRHVRHICGVFHPRAFFMTGERWDRKVLNRLVAKAVGAPSLFFMNEEVRSQHERVWSMPLGTSPIIPLPVDPKEQSWSVRPDCGVLRVVSVGRLVDFKLYNLEAPMIVKRLRESRIEVCWNIFGTGPLETDVRQAILCCGVEGQLKLRGMLDYDKLADTLLRYDVFVGMGTAAVEAAMLGLPTIVAVESSPEETYGWFYEVPFGNVGERQTGLTPPRRISEMLAEFASMPTIERTEVSRKCHEAATRFALPKIAAELISFAEGELPDKRKGIKRAVACLYEAMTRSRLAGRLRQAIRSKSRQTA